MEGFIRYKTLVQLFSDFNFHAPLMVRADSIHAELKAEKMGNDFIFSIGSLTAKDDSQNTEYRQNSVLEYFIYPLSKQLLINGSSKQVQDNPYSRTGGLYAARLIKTNKNSPVKKYEFQPLKEYKERGLFLQPPDGENFYFVARTHSQFREEIGQFLKPNGLEFLLDEETQRPLVVQRQGSSLLSFPMHLVPDTFQRYIFHLAAIMSNHNSVLLFEEPETHSYAPYVYQLAQHIIQDEQNNQYFLTTHNPYFLLPILEEAKDVAVFFTWFENYQTHARRLSEEEIRVILNDGIDVFINPDSLLAV